MPPGRRAHGALPAAVAAVRRQRHVRANGFDVYDCKVFASQADAQAVLRYEPDDPNDLDGDHDGIACPGLPGPEDLRRVPVPPS